MRRLGILLLLAGAALGGGAVAWWLGGGQPQRQYLLDFEYRADPETGTSTMGHLLLFNPGRRPAVATVTVYFEDREPAELRLEVPPLTSRESNFGNWPVAPGQRFALTVASRERLVAQATVGWTNTLGDYAPTAKPRSGQGRHEAAKSFMAIPRLSTDCAIADGVVIDDPKGMWIKESEWAVILNPGDVPAEATLTIARDGALQEHRYSVPARRRLTVFMDPLVEPNRHYGMRLTSSRPVAAQWLRQVQETGSDAVMAFWSVPCTPLRDAR